MDRKGELTSLRSSDSTSRAFYSSTLPDEQQVASYHKQLPENEVMDGKELFQIVTGMYGLCFCYTMLVSYISPLFTEVYGVAFKNLGFVNAATPLTSLLAQQATGTLSDILGQRLICFRVGIIALSVGCLGLAYASRLSS
ncbi:unnamed protein product, partial [Heterosigma akashiwo]